MKMTHCLLQTPRDPASVGRFQAQAHPDLCATPVNQPSASADANQQHDRATRDPGLQFHAEEGRAWSGMVAFLHGGVGQNSAP
jgi:hypothetical protein